LAASPCNSERIPLLKVGVGNGVETKELQVSAFA
jgi:hypothetical protein